MGDGELAYNRPTSAVNSHSFTFFPLYNQSMESPARCTCKDRAEDQITIFIKNYRKLQHDDSWKNLNTFHCNCFVVEYFLVLYLRKFFLYLYIWILWYSNNALGIDQNQGHLYYL